MHLIQPAQLQHHNLIIPRPLRLRPRNQIHRRRKPPPLLPQMVRDNIKAQTRPINIQRMQHMIRARIRLQHLVLPQLMPRRYKHLVIHLHRALPPSRAAVLVVLVRQPILPRHDNLILRLKLVLKLVLKLAHFPIVRRRRGRLGGFVCFGRLGAGDVQVCRVCRSLRHGFLRVGGVSFCVEAGKGICGKKGPGDATLDGLFLLVGPAFLLKLSPSEILLASLL